MHLLSVNTLIRMKEPLGRHSAGESVIVKRILKKYDGTAQSALRQKYADSFVDATMKLKRVL
jgi:hypothetical protein